MSLFLLDSVNSGCPSFRYLVPLFISAYPPFCYWLPLSLILDMSLSLLVDAPYCVIEYASFYYWRPPFLLLGAFPFIPGHPSYYYLFFSERPSFHYWKPLFLLVGSTFFIRGWSYFYYLVPIFLFRRYPFCLLDALFNTQRYFFCSKDPFFYL